MTDRTSIASGIGVGDVTVDGRLDVVASYGGNQPSARLAVFAQTTSGLLEAPMRYTSYDIPEPVEVADVDGDGRADVVTLHSGWLKAGVYRNQVGGILGQEELYSLPNMSSFDPHGLAVGDVTGDGWPDIAIADPNNGLVLLRNTGAGPVPTPSPSIDGPTDAGLHIPADAGADARRHAKSDADTDADATPKPQLPSAPTGLTTSPNLPAGVGLTWTAPSTSGTGPVTGYRIYRGADGSSRDTPCHDRQRPELHRHDGRQWGHLLVQRRRDQHVR